MPDDKVPSTEEAAPKTTVTVTIDGRSIEAQPGARLPGMRRLKAREKAKAEGLTISDALMTEIDGV